MTTKPLISLVHATFGRPEKALAARALWLERAVNPEKIEYIFCLNTDDPTWEKVYAASNGAKIVCGAFAGSAPAWDAGASMANGKLLVQVSDDFVPPADWDIDLCKRIEWEAGQGWLDRPVFAMVSDGYRKDHLCTMAVMTRTYAEQKGHFICPEYRSVFSDDDLTYQAFRDHRDKKVLMVNVRDLVFSHEHHYHNPDRVPFDATYARQNSAEAYALGERLFWERNPEARTDGLRTWT